MPKLGQTPSQTVGPYYTIQIKPIPLLGDTPVVVGFDLVYHRHVGIVLKLLQVTMDERSQLVDGGLGLADLFPEAVEHLPGLVPEKVD